MKHVDTWAGDSFHMHLLYIWISFSRFHWNSAMFGGTECQSITLHTLNSGFRHRAFILFLLDQETLLGAHMNLVLLVETEEFTLDSSRVIAILMAVCS
jgi:hypothetical protein